jgi:hypothetical protein
VLAPGKFYIGWEQDQIFELNVGIDENYSINDAPGVNPDMWYRIDGLWDKTILTGALMMRPIFGKWLTPPVGCKEEWSAPGLDANVYPNPSSGYVRINVAQEKKVSAEMYDLGGKMLLQQEVQNGDLILLDILSAGFYFIKLTDTATGATTTRKIILNK